MSAREVKSRESGFGILRDKLCFCFDLVMIVNRERSLDNGYAKEMQEAYYVTV